MAFLGLRGTRDWGANERPEDWRESILFFFPNGDAPLTALTSLTTDEDAGDAHFHWFTKRLPEQAGDATNVYTDAGLSNAYNGDNLSQGATVYVKAAESLISEFRVGHTAKLRKKDDHRYDTVGAITDRVLNGADSYVAFKLLEDTSATFDLEDVNWLMVTGNANAEGAEMPDAIGYDPTEFDNYTQIFRTPLSITRTARRTRYRTGDKYQEGKRETLQLHGVEMEKQLFHGVKFSTIGDNNKPKRYSQGIINFVETHAADHVDDFSQNSDFSGDSWLQSGEEWLDNQLEKVFRWGSNEKTAWVGSTVVTALNQLAKVSGDIELTPTTTEFGMRFQQWNSPHGTLFFKKHPLFSRETTDRRTCVILEPSNITNRIIDDTRFYEDPQDNENRNNRKDATEEEYLTELGWEYNDPLSFMVLRGFGLDNAV